MNGGVQAITKALADYLTEQGAAAVPAWTRGARQKAGRTHGSGIPSGMPGGPGGLSGLPGPAAAGGRRVGGLVRPGGHPHLRPGPLRPGGDGGRGLPGPFGPVVRRPAGGRARRGWPWRSSPGESLPSTPSSGCCARAPRRCAGPTSARRSRPTGCLPILNCEEA